jgi:hypothetical protein
MAIDESTARQWCIVGGGPSGIGLGKCLSQAGIPYEILEAEDDFGGNWYFGRTSGRVYESTHLISSRINTQFSDFPMPSHYPAYPNHRLFLDYLRSLARHFGLYSHTRFRTSVVRAQPDQGTWLVTGSDGVTRRYRGLFLATGMQREKRLPAYTSQFGGELLHSMDYRSAEVFAGKRVLIAGGGNSGCDIAVDAVHRAASVAHSTRRAYYYMPKFIDGRPTQEWLMDLAGRFPSQAELWAHVQQVFRLAGYDPQAYRLPAPSYEMHQAHPVMNSLILYHIGHGDIEPKPDIAGFSGRRVRFIDGSEMEADLVLMATGYKVSFPFLDPSLLRWKGSRPDSFLYMFHREFDNLLFAGFVNAAAGFGNAANAQGRLFAAYVRARESQTAEYQTFRKMALGPDPDLGNSHFIASERHDFEVDVWKLVRSLNWFRTKLEPATGGAEAHHAAAAGVR